MNIVYTSDGWWIILAVYIISAIFNAVIARWTAVKDYYPQDPISPLVISPLDLFWNCSDEENVNFVVGAVLIPVWNTIYCIFLIICIIIYFVRKFVSIY